MVKVHSSTGRRFYRVGKVDFANQTIAWATPYGEDYDTGEWNAVAVTGSGNAVEVHVGTGRLFYRVAWYY